VILKSALRARRFGISGALTLLLTLTSAYHSLAAKRPQQQPEQQTEKQTEKRAAQSKDDTQEKSEEPKAQQDADSVGDSQASDSQYGLYNLGKDFLGDQKQIWTSPTKLRSDDTYWLVPASGIAAGLFTTDRDVSSHLSNNPQTLSHNKTYSDAGVAALLGGAGAMWLLSYPSHREHWRETGFLAGEAALNSFVDTEVLKYTLGRQRPFQGDRSGSFFSGGTSFPSEHATIAWAAAGVFAHEYPGPIPKILAYGLASFVSYSRVRSKQHFPSDVFVGELMGNMIGQEVYSRHYDPSLGGSEWRPLREIFHVDNPSPSNQGSPYVPLDSWMYEAFERLAGLGLIDTDIEGLRPWTRNECIRLMNEAEDHINNDASGEGARILEALEHEFQQDQEAADENASATFRVESLYSRTEHISGPPLSNGYTFAQTQFNDFGRPYGQGWNTVNGFSASATWGRWFAYVRGEAQTAPGTPSFSLSTREAIQQIDKLPVVPAATSGASVQQFTLLDSYVGLMLSNWELSFGKQSLWWGPGDGGPMMLSDNIEPINMFRVNRVTPFKLPSVLGWLGPMRLEFFLGQLTGYQWVFSPAPVGFKGQTGQLVDPQPFIHGQKLSFKPTRNFEFGIFRTTVYGGPGYPLTIHTLLRSLFSTTNEHVTDTGGSPIKPGDRRSGIDFTYRLPYLRDWVSFYGDGFTDDQFSPIGYADRSAWHAGLFFSHIPKIPKLDLRFEGVYTDNPLGGQLGDGFYYFNYTWRSGYTNNGDLIGSWIGRESQGAQAWTNYWFNARNRLQFNYRHQKVSQGFVPGGGTVTDVGVRGDYWFRPSFGVSASVQYERWAFPIIQPGQQTNVSAMVEFLFQPQKLFRQTSANADLGVGGRP
jgi:Capsule assembly protein Wzi/PAP2 superfamily